MNWIKPWYYEKNSHFTYLNTLNWIWQSEGICMWIYSLKPCTNICWYNYSLIKTIIGQYSSYSWQVYYNIYKTARSFINIQNILLFVSLFPIPHVALESPVTSVDMWKTNKQKTVRKLCTGFRSFRQSNISEVFF